MRRLAPIALFISLGLIVLLAAGQLPAPPAGELPGDAIRGGRIYDNWTLELDLLAPEGEQPLWNTQDNDTISGAATWLCSTCHGWDFQGAEGAYGLRSPFYTGFQGVSSMVGQDQAAVLAWLDGSRDPEHNFTQYFDVTAANDLAAFLRTQQIDTELIIDADSGLALGSDEAGRPLYRANCAQCHGSTGRGISFSDGVLETYLGDVATTNPWRTVHKIRFGLPHSGMYATEDFGWSMARVANLLAYMQTMPRGNPTLPMAQGQVAQDGDLSEQGDIEPVVNMGFVILALILLPLAWDAYLQRKEQA